MQREWNYTIEDSPLPLFCELILNHELFESLCTLPLPSLPFEQVLNVFGLRQMQVVIISS